MQKIVGESSNSTIPVDCITKLNSFDIIVAVDKTSRSVYMLTTTKKCVNEKMVDTYSFHLLKDSKFIPFVYDSVQEILDVYVNQLSFIDVYKLSNLAELGELISKVVESKLE